MHYLSACNTSWIWCKLFNHDLKSYDNWVENCNNWVEDSDNWVEWKQSEVQCQQEMMIEQTVLIVSLLWWMCWLYHYYDECVDCIAEMMIVMIAVLKWWMNFKIQL